jgi:gas vesicle protein
MKKTSTILYGTLIGAATGLAAALLISRRADKNEGEIIIAPGDGLKLGVLLIGLLRAVASIGDD